jgi:hypothetical protein
MENFVWLDPRLDMPAWLFAGIGRIAAEWSYLEWALEETIRILHQTDVKRGRIAAAGMNARTRAVCITSLLQAHELNALSEQFAKLAERLNDHESERNMVAHGFWSKLNSEWFVIRTSGVRSVRDIGKIRRSTLPQRKLITLSILLTGFARTSGMHGRRSKSFRNAFQPRCLHRHINRRNS